MIHIKKLCFFFILFLIVCMFFCVFCFRNLVIYWNNLYSARSRVRGTLEVYHAFIRDLDASDTSSSTNNEPDWELVNDGENETDVESIAHTQVSSQAVSVVVAISNRMQKFYFHFSNYSIFLKNRMSMEHHPLPIHFRLDGRNGKMPMVFQIDLISFPFFQIKQNPHSFSFFLFNLLPK